MQHETIEAALLMPMLAIDIFCAEHVCSLPLRSCLPRAYHFVSSGGIRPY